MATYRVVLSGVLKGLEVREVAPRLAPLCKVPVQGAMALLARPNMVIKGGLSAETAAEYKTALRSVGCNVAIEPEIAARGLTGWFASRSAETHKPFALTPQAVQQHLRTLAELAMKAVATVVGLAQRYRAQAGGQMTPAGAETGGSKSPPAAGTQFKAMGVRSLARIRWAKKSFRATAMIVAGVIIASAAAAGFFVTRGPAPGGPCPAEVDTAKWTDCVGQVNFPNGERYTGGFKDGQPDGRGTLTWPNGERYIGEWKNGKRNGQGKFFWPDGTKYVGAFKNDKKHGQGAMTFANGRKYVGEFKDGNPVGEQRFTSAAPKK